MMNTAFRHTAFAFVATLLLFLLTACGGSGGGSEESGGNPDDGSQGNNSSTGTSSSSGLQVIAVQTGQSKALQDSDDDGLTDDIDPYPTRPTNLSIPLLSSGDSLQLDGVMTLQGQQQVMGSVIQGQSLRLNGKGFNDYGSLIWAVFTTDDGDLAFEVDVLDDNTLAVVAPNIKSYSVRVVTSEWHSNQFTFHWLERRQAALFIPHKTVYKVGESVVLSGQNLSQVERLTIGDSSVVITQKTADTLTFKVPVEPVSNQVQAVTATHVSNPLQFDFRRSIEVLVDSKTPLLENGDRLDLFWNEGVVVLEAPDYRETIEVSAVEPTVVIAAIENEGGRRFIDQMRGVVWPNESTLNLSAVTTVHADIYRHLHRFSASVASMSTQEKQGFWKQLTGLTLVDAFSQQYVGQMRDTAGYPAGLQTERRALFDALSAIEPENKGTAQLRGGATRQAQARSIFATPTLPDDLHVTVAVPRYTPKDQYNNFAVDLHTSLTCKGIESVTPPNNLSPASVCVENDSVVTGSIRVVDSHSGRALSKHVSSVIDPGILGGNYGGYLYLSSLSYPTDSAGQPVCELKPCRIEILTGGFGVANDSSVVLTASEREVADMMKMRTYFELVILTYLNEVTGIDFKNKSCRREVITQLGSSNGSLAAAIFDFTIKMQGAKTNSEQLASLNDTLGKWFLTILTDPEVIASVVGACASDKTVDSIWEHAKGKLGATPRTARGALKMADAFDKIVTGIEVTGPEKIVFDVVYGSRIEGFDSTVDLLSDVDEDTSTVNITFDGNMLVSERGGNEYYPTLAIRDVDGVVHRIPLQASYLRPRSSTDYYTKFYFSVPIGVNLLESMASPASLTLEYTDTVYTGYPQQTLPIPFPSALNILKKPEISSVTPSPLVAGGLVEINGSRLDRFDRGNGIEVFIVSSKGTHFLESVRVQHHGLLTARMPADVSPGSYELFVAEKGYQASGGGGAHYLADNHTVQVDLLPGVRLFVQDRGQYEDDKLIIKLYRAGNDENPVDTVTLPDSQGNYGTNISWNPSTAGQNINWINIGCADTGRDSLCTYYLDIQGAALYKRIDCSGSAIRKESGKFSKGDENVYNVGSRSGSGCQN